MQQAAEPNVYPRVLRRVRAALVDSVAFIGLFLAWFWSFGVLDDVHVGLKLAPLLAGLLILEPGLVAWTGGTIGHHLMGLRIRDATVDRRLGVMRASARALVRMAFGWLSYILILVTHRHQAIHDYVCGSIVVLRRPAEMPDSEKLAARQIVPSGFELPGAWRRFGIIALWSVLSLVALLALTELFLSESCLYYDNCAAWEEALGGSLSLLWLGGIVAIVVGGCRGRLYGCRRRPRPAAAPQSAPHSTPLP